MEAKRSTCCFCIELRTGSLIIGYLNLIGTIIMMIYSILGMISLGVVLDSTHNLKLDQAQLDSIKTFGNFASVILIIVLIFQVLNLLFVIVLLAGLHKEKPRYVRVYLIYSAIFLVLNITVFMIAVLTGGAVDTIVTGLINIVFGIYFLVVIRSYWVKMTDAPKRPAIYNTA